MCTDYYGVIATDFSAILFVEYQKNRGDFYIGLVRSAFVDTTLAALDSLSGS